MKKVLIFQHVPYEILGTFHPLLKDAGFRLRYVNYGRKDHPTPDIARYDGLIVLGGPMGVYETEKYPHLPEEIRLIRGMIEQGKPVLGICLGAQLIAAALGNAVYPNKVKEIGWYDVDVTPAGKNDPLFSHFKGSEKIFQWHKDRFLLPEGAALLAGTKTCEHQAFRFRSHVYGFQFHMEVDEATIERWLGIPHHRAEIEELEGDALYERIRAETRRNIRHLKSLSSKTFREYIRLFSFKTKYRSR